MDDSAPDSVETLEEDVDMKIVPNAMFPFCSYNNDYSEGVLVNEYDERYCNSFQVMLNHEIDSVLEVFCIGRSALD